MFRRDFFRTLLGGAMALVGIKARPAPRYLPLGKPFVPEPSGQVWSLPLTYNGYPIIVEGRLPPPG